MALSGQPTLTFGLAVYSDSLDSIQAAGRGMSKRSLKERLSWFDEDKSADRLAGLEFGDDDVLGRACGEEAAGAEAFAELVAEVGEL